MNSIRSELKGQGIESEGGEDELIFDNSLGHINEDDFANYKLDAEIKAVVVGLDTKYTYSKLAIASLYI